MEVKRACCEVDGEWTWSKLKLCFFVVPAAWPGAAPGALEGSIETEVGVDWWTTTRWNRVGIDDKSCCVPGLMRTAIRCRGMHCQLARSL